MNNNEKNNENEIKNENEIYSENKYAEYLKNLVKKSKEANQRLDELRKKLYQQNDDAQNEEEEIEQ